MINRVLIRIKVVQMLYSYLLTRGIFRIEKAPERDGRDNRFAYQTYKELLILILKLSGINLSTLNRAIRSSLPSGNSTLQATTMAQSLITDSDVRDLIAHFHPIADQSRLLPLLLEKIEQSSVLKDFKRKRKKDLSAEVELWRVIIESILLNDEDLTNYFKSSEDYTLTGMRRGFEMIKSTLNSYEDSRSMIDNGRRLLNQSFDQSRLLYFALLRLPVDIARLREENIESAKEKYLPSADDLNPNLRLVDSPVVKAIENSKEINAFFKSMPFTWDNDYFLIRKMLDYLLGSELYKNYVAKPKVTFAEDCEFWRDAFKQIFLQSDELSDSLEAKSVYWNDDLAVMGTFVMKTLRHWATAGNAYSLELLPMFKDDEDERFGDELFTLAAKNAEEYRGMIDSFIDENSWDPDRIAFMDIVILTTAIAELINFPKIPVPVTLNEYIEIANYYSAPRSGQFINGIMFSIVNKLNEQGIIHKSL